MAAVRVSLGKTVSESLKASCRFLARPILPILPDALVNRFPFLGRACIKGPNGLTLRMHTHGPHGKDRIALKLAKRGFWAYEAETIRVFLPLVKQARGVFDVGANTGLFALIAARANAGCRVWAFEPVPFIFEMLQNNIRLNELSNLHAISSAVSDSTGTTTFFVTHTHVGVPLDSSACAGFRSDVEPVTVPTTTLDDHMASTKTPHLDVLKIDAEATECSVIRGSERTLRDHRPFVICEVLENVDHGFVQSRFESLDYRFYHIGPEHIERHANLQGSLAVDARNYVFVPAEKQPIFATVCQEAAIAVR